MEEQKTEVKDEKEVKSIVKVDGEDDTKPRLWLNKLRYYPPDFLKENMVSFREMMYEDLLRDSSQPPKRTL